MRSSRETAAIIRLTFLKKDLLLCRAESGVHSSTVNPVLEEEVPATISDLWVKGFLKSFLFSVSSDI